MFDRIRNAWSLAKSSWRVLQHDRELAWLPVIGGVAALVIGAAFFGPVAAMLGGTENESIPVAGWIVAFAGYVAVSTVVYLARAAVVHGANTRMEGGDPGVASSLRGAAAHWPAVAGFAAIAVTVGLILEAIEDQGGFIGQIASFIGGAAWRLLTYLVLPVMIIEDTGAVSAIKQSSALVKRTWGEQVTGNVGFGLLTFALMIPAFVLAGAVASLGVAALTIVVVVAAFVWVVGVAATVSALEAVFQTALYRQVTGRSIPGEFDASQLQQAARRR